MLSHNCVCVCLAHECHTQNTIAPMERGDILLPNDVENDVFRFDLDQSNRVSVSRSQCIIPNTDDMAMAYFVSPISTICFFFFLTFCMMTVAHNPHLYINTPKLRHCNFKFKFGAVL